MESIVPSELVLSGPKQSKPLDKETQSLDEEAMKLAAELGL